MKTPLLHVVIFAIILVLVESAPQRRNNDDNQNVRITRRRKQNFPLTSTTTSKPIYDEILELFPDDEGEFEVFLSELKRRKNNQQTSPVQIDRTFDQSDIEKNPFLQEIAMQQAINSAPVTRRPSRPTIGLNPQNPFFTQDNQPTTTRRPTHQFVGFEDRNPNNKNPQQGILDTNPFFNSEPKKQNKRPNSAWRSSEEDFPEENQDHVFSRFAQQEDHRQTPVGRPKIPPLAPLAPKIKTSIKKEDIPNAESERLFKEQAKNAKYAFASDVTDDINENNQRREEIRDGLAVRGQYSYSDGYVKVTVKYEADDKGFRIVGEDRENIGDGPSHNPGAKAQVKTYVDGNAVKYQISEDDIIKRTKSNGKVNILELLEDEDGEQ